MSMPEPLGGIGRGAVDLSSLVNAHRAPQGQAGAPAAGAPAGGTPPAGAIPVPSLVLDAGDSDFQQIIALSSTVPVIVNIGTEASSGSAEMDPLLEKVTLEYGGRLLLVRIDAAQNPQLSQAFQASAVPTVAAVIAGQPAPLWEGVIDEAEVRNVFEQVLAFAAQNGVTGTLVVEGADAAEPEGEPEPAPLPPLHQEAFDAIERGDYAAAIDAYTRAIAQNPRDAEAEAGLAQVRLLARLQGETSGDIRAAAAAAPDDIEAQLAVADLDVSGGHVDDAFDRLLQLFGRLPADQREPVRTRLVELFGIVGVADPRVIAARRSLTALLY